MHKKHKHGSGRPSENLRIKMPAVTEDIKWEHDLLFSVGGKMFCVAGLDQQPTSASFKVTDETFDETGNRPGFKPAPYMARLQWVWVDDLNRIKKKEWQKMLATSYELVKDKLPAKLKNNLACCDCT